MTVFRKVSKVVLPVIATGGILALVLTEIAKEEETEYRETENYLQNSPVNQMVKSIDSIQDEAEKRHIIAQEKEKQRAKEMFARIDAEVARIKEKDRQKELARLKAIEEEKKRKQLAIQSAQNKKAIADNTVKSGWTNAELTHYTAFCPEGCTGISASGDYLGNSEYYKGYRVVASYKGLPLYTIVEVLYPDGTSFQAVVLDRGGAISHSGILDVLVSTESKARKLGRQKGKYRVIGKL